MEGLKIQPLIFQDEHAPRQHRAKPLRFLSFLLSKIFPLPVGYPVIEPAHFWIGVWIG